MTRGALVSASLLTLGCWEAAIGDPPPVDELHFPSGLALDPRVPAGDKARWLFVANANSDLVLNGSSILAVDLDAFHDAWQSGPILEPGAEVSSERPCRHNADRPQLIECLDKRFIAGDATVYLTSFATVLRGYAKDGVARLMTPVRGDPSISYVDIAGGLGNGPLELRCGVDPEVDEPRCGGTHRLQFLFNDEDRPRIPLEPANIHISLSDYHDDIAIVSHFRSAYLTLIDLEANPPQVVDISPQLANLNSNGGYGLAQWPCSEEAAPSFTRVERYKPVPIACDTINRCGVEGVICDVGVCQATTEFDCSAAADAACEAIGQLCVLENNEPTCVTTPPACDRDDDCGAPSIECAFPTGGACWIPEDVARCDAEQEAAAACAGDETCVLDLIGAPDCVPASCSRDSDCVVSGVRCQHAGECLIPEGRACGEDFGAGLQCVTGTACGRPLLYAGAREIQGAVTFTSSRIVPALPTEPEVCSVDSDCENDERCLEQQCIPDALCIDLTNLDEELPESGNFLCEQRLVSDATFATGGFDVGAATDYAINGEMAFSPDGNTLYVVQTNPGGLVRVDTSLDEKGRPVNLPAGVIEICAEPNAMTLFSDDSGEYAAITCHRPALVFIVELRSFRVVSNIIAGTGPHELVYDAARNFLYVANSLGATISVIDVDNSRTTRFTEVARIGLEDPYSS
ncbi:MAG: hypothetical protein KC468_07245 [Myxococcales bacterium]|nr:hypothetical protein [Myxococcales bacterium]